jgi:uncharacterized OB-fold protein
MTSVLVPELFDPDAPGGPALVGGRCRACGEALFPYRPVCPACKRWEVERVHLSRTGTLYSFTVCHTAPLGWKAPYLQAYVELPEGVRVFTLISDEVTPAVDALEVGMPMELVAEAVGSDGAGREVVTYKFRPRRPAPGGEGTDA